MGWNSAESVAELRTAIEAFDRPRVAALCGELAAWLHSGAGAYPRLTARDILAMLRAKRHFDLMQLVADAFMQAGLDWPVVRRQYAQALMDQGVLTAAVAVLERLVADTPDLSAENAEARGLLGRAYKQMYVLAGPASPRAPVLLDRALAEYQDVYLRSDRRKLWHGINAAALLHLAGRDGVRLASCAEPDGRARQVAAEVLERIEELGDDATAWDRATAMEACIALDRHDEALQWLDSYLRSADADAFELASTLRQLTEVWRLDATTEPGARLIPVLQSEQLRRQGGAELLISPDQLATASLQRLEEFTGLEAIHGTDRFSSIAWFRRALERCRAVARIEDTYESGVGTGFLVAGTDLHPSYPELVMVTNAHVVSADDPLAINPDQAVVTFRAVESTQGSVERYGLRPRLLWTSPAYELDVTIAELDRRPPNAVVCPVARHRPRLDGPAPPQTYIIGHPGGDQQVMLSIKDNCILDADDVRLHYRTPTRHGSSGSPVFNAAWELIALHHRGEDHMPRLHGQAGTYPANEGIWINRIRARLAEDPRHDPAP